ncbi:MAG TPA: rhodanese-like domain-containing protein [Candidatus Limnocylindrales bacterium]
MSTGASQRAPRPIDARTPAANTARSRGAHASGRALGPGLLATGGARLILSALGAVGVVFVAVSAIALLSGSNTPPQGGARLEGAVVEGRGGHWTNIAPDRLEAMLDNKDFTLLNVKTPYVGEIVGTDLYIPYDALTSRAAELPVDKGARVVVYCRTGRQSAIAAQTLIDLGYTNVGNLDGGMAAWIASGGQLVSRDRTGG